MIELYIKLCLIMIELYDKTGGDEIQLCLIIIVVYIKQLMMKYNFI